MVKFMFIFFGLILANSLPEKYVVVRLAVEKSELKNTENIEDYDLNIEGEDYASNIVGSITGSKITLGCGNDVGVYGHVANSVIEYQCGDQLKRIINGERYLARNSLLTTLPYVGKEFKIKFDLYVDSYIKDDWRNVIHFTQGGNGERYGERIPGIWINRDNRLYMSSALNGNRNHMEGFSALPVGKWNHIGITQQFVNYKYMFKVFVNNVLVFKLDNKDPRVFRNVKVYASDPWYEPVNGRIKDLRVETRKDRLFSL